MRHFTMYPWRYIRRLLTRCVFLPILVLFLLWYALVNNAELDSGHERHRLIPVEPYRNKDTRVNVKRDMMKDSINKKDLDKDTTKRENMEKNTHSQEKLKRNITIQKDIQKVITTKKYDPNAPGELGKDYVVKRETLKTEAERLEYDMGWKNHNFNEYVSNRISLHRKLPDPRDPACRTIQYSRDLPDASIIMTFHNEAWSVLLRSIHSIIDRTPAHLLKEIILVDDFSDMEHLKLPLDEYIKPLKIVQIIRTGSREGLIRARLIGYHAATAKVMVFLDSHIECAEGWIEPLLDPISRNWSTVVTPVIDNIDDKTFRFCYLDASQTYVGGFDWSLKFWWHHVPESEKKRREYKHYLPVRTPTMAGGLFAISRKYFQYLGTYDEGMEIWGGENLELSFRIWMCGGSLLTAPCSQVGHIFRSSSPYTWGSKKNMLKSNNVRLAEVWMDEFKEYYYKEIGHDLGDYGNVTARKNLRKNLKCKSFEWYLTNVYPEIYIPGEAIYSGEIRSQSQPMCLDAPSIHDNLEKQVTVFSCHGQGGNQFWMYSNIGEIRHNYGCLDSPGKEININVCHGLGGNQKWQFRADNTIYKSLHDKCLELSADGQSVSMKICDGNDRQKWNWERKSPDGPVRHIV